MNLNKGARMWIPCKVAQGPFSDERVVHVQADGKEWSGFVNVKWLKEGVERGVDEVLARVVEVEGETFYADIPGDALQSSLFEGSVRRVRRVVPHGPLET